MRRIVTPIAALFLLAWAGCSSDSDNVANANPDDAGAPDHAPSEAAPDAPPAVDAAQEPPGSPIVELRLFHTSDEHGWLKPAVEGGKVLGGVANVYAWWVHKDGFDSSRDLALSSGDIWGGPAISDYFKGEPVIQAFNLMGYAATALGNHEFDWGTDLLSQRMSQATFPMLSANVRIKSSGELFATPYAIVPVQGVEVGIIGLTTPDTATATNPKNVSHLTFDDLAATLEATVPEVRKAGADVVVVLAHAYHVDAAVLAEQLGAPVDVLLSGHDHGIQSATHGGVLVTGSGWAWRSYSITTLTYDKTAQAVTGTDRKLVHVAYADENPVVPDPALQQLTDGWDSQLSAALGQQIGYSATGLPLGSWAQGNWITDAWLAAFPEADVAVQNFGGIRAPLPSGPITLESIYDLLPFENRIFEVQLTGAQLAANLTKAVSAYAMGTGGYPAVAGLTFRWNAGLFEVTLSGGAPLDSSATYRVLTNDYLYNGGNGYLFGQQDPTPIDLGVNCREPVIQWTTALGTSPSNPLEAHVDAAPRNQ